MKYLQLFLTVFFLNILFSCDDGSPTSIGDNNGTGNGITKDFTTLTGGRLETASGFMIEVKPGCVPNGSDGNPATITFSIEENVPEKDLPVAIPSKYTLASKVVAFGPNGFTFGFPVTVWFPAKNEPSPDGLFIIHFDEIAQVWKEVPVSGVDMDTRQIGGSCFTLGYFALVRRGNSGASFKHNDKLQAADSEGGVKFADIVSGTGPDLRYGAWYVLTIKDFTLKYPNQAEMYQYLTDCDLSSAVTPSDPTSTFPRHPTKFRLPQGTFHIWVTVFSYSVAAQWHSNYYTYTIPITVTINNPITYYGWGSEDDASWTKAPPLTDGGTWKDMGYMRPNFAELGMCWSVATIPYGTGYFKATLKWVNTSTNATDFDLHLYGPSLNGVPIHIYWDDKPSKDSSLVLDRDWTSENGSAIENIFSLKDMPNGKYDIKVRNFANHRGSNPPSFQVDIKRGSYFKTYRYTLPTAGDEILIESFNL
jgi:hypothetical protein